MAIFKFSDIVSGIFFIIALTTEVSPLVWKLKQGQSGSGGNLGTHGGFYGDQGMRGDYGQWGGSGGQGWGNPGWNDAWINQGNRGSSKGSTYRSCYDSRQCWPGECCRATGYGAGRCDSVAYGSTYGCIQPRPNNDGWQKPIYPQKPGVWDPPRNIDRPGFCPPQMLWKGPGGQLCRQDQDCPTFQKCCYVQGKSVCMNAVFT